MTPYLIRKANKKILFNISIQMNYTLYTVTLSKMIYKDMQILSLFDHEHTVLPFCSSIERPFRVAKFGVSIFCDFRLFIEILALVKLGAFALLES